MSVRWTDPDSNRVEEIFGEISANLLEGRFSRTVPEFQVAATVAAYAEVLRGSRHVAVDLGGVLDEALALPREAGPAGPAPVARHLSTNALALAIG